MKNNKKYFIGFGIILVIGIIATIFIINFVQDKNKLTILEKQWINNNSNMVFNVGVKNNTNIFGNDGTGVFYDFLNDFSSTYDLTINPTTYTSAKSTENIYFRTTNKLSKKDILLYQDHYVLIGKTNVSLASDDDLQNRHIGVLSRQLSQISKYLDNVNNISFTSFESKDELIKEFDKQDKIKYILVPLLDNMQIVLQEDNFINYHISDIPVYYTLYENDKNDKLAIVMRKYLSTWQEEKFKYYLNQDTFEMFTDTLKISDEQKDKLRNKTYNYGFIENNPYETISAKSYGGIVGSYLEKFKQFSGIDIKYTRYKDKRALLKSIDRKEIDFFYNYYDLNTQFTSIPSLMNIKYYIIMSDDNYQVVNNLKSLINEDIYVLEGSLLQKYLASQQDLNIKTYKNLGELKSLAHKKKIIALDSNNFDYYNKKEIKDYTVRYTQVLDSTYKFNSDASNTFNNLLTKYIMILDPKEIVNEGVYSNRLIVRSSSILGRIARYIIYIIVILIIVGIIVYRSSRKIKIAKRIKKEDKMRFIDQLTSMKNRNYLNENIESWNNNTIYPQTLLVIDINNIQYINDTFGYGEGDRQIKAAANCLIKLQLDNSDIIRTDGTEFVVYLVGYSEKQVANFMRKLTKEFKKLPYEYGAVMGYSVINDDIKTIEDAINEATLAMKDKKNEKEENESKEKNK